MVSSVAGVTLLVLVSMTTLGLVCGGQERGKDSRLMHTHFAHTQPHYSPGGVVSFSSIQKTPYNKGLITNHEHRSNGTSELINLHSQKKNKLRSSTVLFAKEKKDSVNTEGSGLSGSADECNEVYCNDITHVTTETGRTGVESNKVIWDEMLNVAELDRSMDGPVVFTESGPVRGLTLDTAHIFYGIPYAAPPIGLKRWAAPKPVLPWKKPYDATFPRAACMQTCTGEFSKTCLLKVSEDCLYLNIYVPVSVDLLRHTLKRLPVMLWIHGGDFIAGSASKPLYDGRFISNYSRTVVVNVAYRLGAFGFLLTGKDARTTTVGNYGILDQQAAMRWVQNNIAAFGGDPEKVTLFGESAGAQSVCLHLMMKSSETLFRHAIIQSQPFSIPLKSRWEAMKLGRSFVKWTNCSMSDLMCLRSLSSDSVLQAQVKAGSKIINPFRFLEVFETWGPYIDGDLITEQPIVAFNKGYWQSYKPVILGTTSEEGVLFVNGVFTQPVSMLECIVYTTAIFKQHSLRILQNYIPLYHDQDRRIMLSQIVTDFVFLCPTRWFARATVRLGGSVWTYVFDHTPIDHSIWAGLFFCYSHACHGAELPFLFDSATVANFTLTAQETSLANQMVCYWGAFAHSGNPNSHSEQTDFCRQQRLTDWPKYTPAERWPVMNLTLQSHSQLSKRDRICDFWDQLDIY